MKDENEQVKDEKEKRLIRQVNEEVSGLLLDDRDTDKISEAFGWGDKKFDKVLRTLTNYQRFQQSIDQLEEELPQSTKISQLADFLKSNNFKRLAINIDSPNDYFMLGYCFAIAIYLDKKENDPQGMSMGMPMGGMSMNPQNFLQFLKAFRKYLEENNG